MNQQDDQKEARAIAVDFDGTLAAYDGWKGADHLGEPIPEMVEKIKAALAEGAEVYIFTARVNPGSSSFDDALSATKSYLLIAQWCQQVFGRLLPITHEKSQRFTEIIDDRAIQVVPNSGLFVTELLDAAGKQQ